MLSVRRPSVTGVTHALIAYLRGQGVTEVYVSCGETSCQRGSVLTFEAICPWGDTPFP